MKNVVVYHNLALYIVILKYFVTNIIKYIFNCAYVRMCLCDDEKGKIHFSYVHKYLDT